MDPLTALAAVSAAVNLVKKAVKTVDDVRSLGPVLGKYFDAKADAVKVLEEVNKGGFKGSNMGKAVELELAIHSAREFEEEVKQLFFPNNMDVWHKIVARRQAAKRRATDAAIQARKRRQENLELWSAIILATVIVGFMLWGGIEILKHCQVVKCGN
jgi:hypothetical protein